MPKKIDKEKAKKVIEKTATTTFSITKKTVVIVFVIIVFYTIAVTLVGFLRSGQDFSNVLQNIATLSVGGFWAFFLGYFGWRMGEAVEHYLVSMKNKE